MSRTIHDRTASAHAQQVDRRRLMQGSLAVAATAALPQPAQAVEMCDLLLALSADVSRLSLIHI